MHMTCGICTQEGLDAEIARWRECKKWLLASRQILHFGHSAEIACRQGGREKRSSELRVVEYELIEQEGANMGCVTPIKSMKAVYGRSESALNIILIGLAASLQDGAACA
jgi:hypothetical protein